MALGAAIVLAAGCGPSPHRAPVSYRVDIRAMKYEPAVVRAARGDTVRWTNGDLVPHTVTSSTRAFDSGSLAPDSSWSLVIGQDGALSYSCQFHPAMRGSLVVAP